jgi:hypothetical protein
MRWFRSHRVPRALSSLVALALFLAGSNYCLVGALSAHGKPVMACHAAPASEAASACTSHCGHSAPARSQAAVHTPPCCIVVTPVSTPSAEKPALIHDAAPLALLSAAEALPAPALRVEAVHSEHAPPADPASRAPLSSRAPPLS